MKLFSQSNIMTVVLGATATVVGIYAAKKLKV